VCPTTPRWGPCYNTASKLSDLDLVWVCLGFIVGSINHELLIAVDWLLLWSLQVSLELRQAIRELLALNVLVIHRDELVIQRLVGFHLPSRILLYLCLFRQSMVWLLVLSAKGADQRMDHLCNGVLIPGSSGGRQSSSSWSLLLVDEIMRSTKLPGWQVLSSCRLPSIADTVCTGILSLGWISPLSLDLLVA